MIADYIAGKIILFIFVSICAYEDFKYKSIDVRVYVLMYICEFVFYMYLIILSRKLALMDIALGAFIGVALFVASRLGLNIGEGDAHFFIIMGLGLGFTANVKILLCTLILISVVDLYIITIDFINRVNSKNKVLPMLVFAFPVAGYILFS